MYRREPDVPVILIGWLPDKPNFLAGPNHPTIILHTYYFSSHNAIQLVPGFFLDFFYLIFIIYNFNDLPTGLGWWRVARR
jgi:hypothetical protein